MSWLAAPRRKALYALGASIGALAVFYGLVTEDEAVLWLALIPSVLNVLSYTKTVDPVSVTDEDSPTNESAGDASPLPEGTPTVTTSVDEDDLLG